MANTSNHNDKEPSSAPHPEKWYTLKLGSSFNGNSRSKYCTLRYEFKPASIDKTQAGSLHKNKANRVTVEFQNNQPGKQKVVFEGSCEDYKGNDAVLFFDGENFRLERLHRGVKRLRHVRLPGESVASAAQPLLSSAGLLGESRSSPLGKSSKLPVTKASIPVIPVEVERIDVGEANSASKSSIVNVDHLPMSSPNTVAVSPEQRTGELEENIDILADDNDDTLMSHIFGARTDIHVSNNDDMDDEIADVDLSDDDERGPNAAEALRAQVNAEGDGHSSSSSDSSGSASSDSGSASATSSSGSERSDDDSASSGGEVDI